MDGGEAYIFRLIRLGEQSVIRRGKGLKGKTMAQYSPNVMASSFICAARHNPSGEFIICGDRRIRWKEFTPRVLKIANALIGLGVKKGDKVAFMFHNTPEFLEVNAGIQAAGAVPAPMNYRFIPREVEYQGNHCDAHVFIYDSIWAEAVEAASSKLTKIKHWVTLGASNISGAFPYEEFVASGKEDDPGVATGREDVAVMIYTGGTTGFPKGVMLTYGAHVDMFSTLLAAALQRTLTMDMPKDRHKKVVEHLPLPAKSVLGPILRTRVAKKFFARESTFERLRETMYKRFTDPDEAKKAYGQARKYAYPSMPFFHDASYANLMMGMMSGSMIVVLIPSVKFDPALTLEVIQNEEVAQVSNVPTGWKKLVDFPGIDKYNLEAVRVCTTGGGVCPAPLKKKILRAFPNALVLDAFGQTEMTPVTSFRFDWNPDDIKDRSVGRSIVEVKVVDGEGKELPKGEVGEILYKSSTVMKGYYKDDEKTSEVLSDGWFRSGDLGYVDEEGEIRTVDRKKECINTGGEKVFPLEVEQVIEEHEKVDTVCIIGVPDDEWGNAIRAVVVLKDGQQMGPREVMDFCRGKIAGYKIPRSVVFTDELPYSPVGKMLRQKIRDLYGAPEAA